MTRQGRCQLDSAPDGTWKDWVVPVAQVAHLASVEPSIPGPPLEHGGSQRARA
jgi:hypothetical protein